MNLLFIHPTPGLGWQRSYRQAVRLLRDRTGHNVVMAYNGPRIEEIEDGRTVYNFNEWARANRERIDAVSALELERRYPRSNLWLGIVSERRVSNYSLLDGSYPTARYGQEELVRLVKSIVLFYEEIIETNGVQAVMAHHPDNIHSTLLFEMALSRPFECFLIFPDYYWSQETNFLMDSKYFTSSTFIDCYRRNMDEYEKRVVPITKEIEEYIAHRTGADPAEKSKNLLPRLTFRKNLVSSLKVLGRRDLVFNFGKPDIIDGYGQVHFATSVKAWLHRSANLLANRYSRVYSTEVPDGPFVYFPLQRVPEAAMLVRATSYLNQQGLAQAISASLPCGHKLVMKDHPKSVGYFPPGYYRKLLELPNTVVLDPRFSNSRILDRASLVVTIGGTLGLQQLMSNKPVVMFGRKFYEILEGVVRVDDMNRLPYVLKDLLVNGKAPDPVMMKRSLYSYVAALQMTKYETPRDSINLHRDPEALASLVGEMIEREIRQKVEGTSAVGIASGAATTSGV